MYQAKHKTRQGVPVLRLSKTQARKRFNAGQPITATEASWYPDSTPDIIRDDGTDPMIWPSVTDFDALANEQDYYAHNGVWWWGIDTPSGLQED